MKVSFEATLDDYVDITMRSVRPNYAYYQNLILLTIGVGIAIGGLAYLITQNWTAASIGFAVGAAYIVFSNFGYRERVFRKIHKTAVPLDKPSLVTVDIAPEGISFETHFGQQNETIFRTWDTVEAIEQTDDAIYFRKKGNLYSAVRKRGFANTEEMNEFLVLANHYWSDAKAAKPSSGS